MSAFNVTKENFKTEVLEAVGKVNVDEQPELAEQFKVMTIPSLFVFQNGEHGEAIIAPGSKAQIEEFMRAQGAL